MRILDYMERLQTLTRLLKKEHTGSPTKMARNMGVHRLTVFNYIKELRAMGAEINMTINKIHIISRNHLISN